MGVVACDTPPHLGAAEEQAPHTSASPLCSQIEIKDLDVRKHALAALALASALQSSCRRGTRPTHIYIEVLS